MEIGVEQVLRILGGELPRVALQVQDNLPGVGSDAEAGECARAQGRAPRNALKR